MSYKTRAPRHQTEKIPIAIRETGTFAWQNGLILNLSATGVQIFTHAKLKPDALIEIEFTTKDAVGKSNRRKMKAKIVWYSGRRYGCEFKLR